MDSIKEKIIETDVLVVGAGGAGCFAALKAQEKGASVKVVNKVPWIGGCTMIARGGYSAAMGASDSRDNPDMHMYDTVRGGNYMGNQKVIKVMCQKTVEATHDLLKWEARFRKRNDGELDQGNKCIVGHSYPRLVKVAGEFAHIGKTIMEVLQRKMKEKSIEVIDNVMITNLLTDRNSIAGAVGLDWRDGSLITFNTKAVIMATGGTGHLYKYTDNPTYMTGDGHAAMYRAGAELVDMEFIDFFLRYP